MDPRLTDNLGEGRSSTHNDRRLSDQEPWSEEDVAAIYEGWGFDEEDYDE